MSLEELMIVPDIFNVSNINELNTSLLNGCNINEKNHYEETPLLYAIRDNKKFELIEEFLKLGADVNAQDCWGITPFYVAVTKHGEKLDLIELLVENGGNILGGKPFSDRALEQVFIHNRPCAELLIRYKFLKNQSLIKQRASDENSPPISDHYLEYKEVVDLNINRTFYISFSDYFDKCSSEVLHMQSVQLCSRQSLLDFASGNISSVCLHSDVLCMQYFKLCHQQASSKCIPGKVSLKYFQPGIAKQAAHQIFKELNSFHYVVYKSIIASRIGRDYLISEIVEQLYKINEKASLHQSTKTCLNSDVMYFIAKFLSDEDLLNFLLAHLKVLITIT